MEYKKNADGTDMLDENGNPIPVEITNKGTEADKIKAALAPLVEEIKELKTSNSLLKDMIKNNEKPTPLEPAKPLTDDERIAQIVNSVLQKEKSSDAQANKIAAFEKFVTENKEFHPDNDPTGLKRDALQKKLDSFNTGHLTKVEEFLTVIGDAKTLLMGNDSSQDTSRGNQIPNSPTPKGSPSGKQDEILTPRELKLAEQTGRTKEDILKMKTKHPALLQDLLDYVRD